MMRRRMIDPGFWKDAKIGNLTPPARLAFIFAWNAADDEGRMDDWNAATMRGGCMAYDDITLAQADQVINEIAAQRLILPYIINAHLYHIIPNFRKYQTINRPTESKLPPPPFDVSSHDTISEDSVTAHGVISEDSCNVSPKLSKDKLSKDKLSESCILKDTSASSGDAGLKRPRKQRIILNRDTFKVEGVAELDRERWQEIAPLVNLNQEIAKFETWCCANPDRAPRVKVMGAITKWLNKAQGWAAKQGQGFNQSNTRIPKVIPKGCDQYGNEFGAVTWARNRGVTAEDIANVE